MHSFLSLEIPAICPSDRPRARFRRRLSAFSVFLKKNSEKMKCVGIFFTKKNTAAMRDAVDKFVKLGYGDLSVL